MTPLPLPCYIYFSITHIRTVQVTPYHCPVIYTLSCTLLYTHSKSSQSPLHPLFHPLIHTLSSTHLYTHSPPYHSETLDGLPTLRAYKSEDRFRQKNDLLLDANQKAYFLNFSANCWLAVRLELVGATPPSLPPSRSPNTPSHNPYPPLYPLPPSYPSPPPSTPIPQVGTMIATLAA